MQRFVCRFPKAGTLGRAAGYALAQRVNAARVFRRALKRRAAEGSALNLTKNNFVSSKLFL